MKIRFRNVAAIMPPKTVVPTERRLMRPAPCARTSGRTPRMKASEVIRIGRRRISGGFDGGVEDAEAFFAQLLGELDDQDRVLAGEADQHDQADLAVDVVFLAAQSLRADGAEQRHRNGEQAR